MPTWVWSSTFPAGAPILELKTYYRRLNICNIINSEIRCTCFPWPFPKVQRDHPLPAVTDFFYRNSGYQNYVTSRGLGWQDANESLPLLRLRGPRLLLLSEAPGSDMSTKRPTSTIFSWLVMIGWLSSNNHCRKAMHCCPAESWNDPRLPADRKNGQYLEMTVHKWPYQVLLHEW